MGEVRDVNTGKERIYTESLDVLVENVKEKSSSREPSCVPICGFTSSGKSTIAKKLCESLHRSGVPLPYEQSTGAPVVIEMDMFYRNDTSEIANSLGGNFDHPFLIDTDEVSRLVSKIKEGRIERFYMPVYSFKEGRRVGKRGPFKVPKNAVILVEGLYALNSLKEMSDLSIYVESSPLELVARRIIRDMERTSLSPEQILEVLSIANTTYRIYGEKQKYDADMIYRNAYEILKDKGNISFQTKIPLENSKVKDLYRSLKRRKKVEFEDVIVKERENGNASTKILRGRTFWENKRPEKFELSYRELDGEKSVVTSYNLEMPPQAYTALILLSSSLNMPLQSYHRERETGKIRYGGEVLEGKVDLDKKWMEISGKNKKTLTELVRKLGVEPLRISYYD